MLEHAPMTCAACPLVLQFFLEVVVLVKVRYLLGPRLVMEGPAGRSYAASIRALSTHVLSFTSHEPALKLLFANGLSLVVVMFAVGLQFAQPNKVFVVLTII